MTFLGYTSGVKGFKFMRKPNNVIFQAVTALFDEFMFPYCPDNKSPGHTHIRREYPSEDNIPPEEGGWFDGGAYPPHFPNIPAGNVPPAVQPGPQNPPLPPASQRPQGAPQPPLQPPAQQRPAAPQRPWLEPGLTSQERDEAYRYALLRDPATAPLASDSDTWNSYRHDQPWNQGDPEATTWQSFYNRDYQMRNPTLLDEGDLTPPIHPVGRRNFYLSGSQTVPQYQQMPQALPPVFPEAGPSIAPQPR